MCYIMQQINVVSAKDITDYEYLTEEYTKLSDKLSLASDIERIELLERCEKIRSMRNSINVPRQAVWDIIEIGPAYCFFEKMGV